jgi:hypothetical protein
VFENLSENGSFNDLLIGIRGSFEAKPHIDDVGGTLPHTAERWGLTPCPWVVYDSGADLVTEGSDVLRGWCHVGVSNAEDADPDLPVSGLLRMTCDTLALYGALVSLTGIDAVIPVRPDCRLSPARVLGIARSVIADKKRLGEPRNVAVFVALPAYPTAAEAGERMRDVLRHATDADARFTGVRVPDSFLHASGPALARVFDGYVCLGFEVEYASWSIDDASWLVEVAAVSANALDCGGAVQISVRVA